MKNILIVIIVMLILALFQLPYGYYKLLKIMVCGFSTYFLFKNANIDNLEILDICLLIIAVMYNPIIPISFSRDIWSFINIGTIIIFILYGRKIIKDETI